MPYLLGQKFFDMATDAGQVFFGHYSNVSPNSKSNKLYTRKEYSSRCLVQLITTLTSRRCWVQEQKEPMPRLSYC